ncbi:MAG TPA: quinohemoprotein amine dehydrogenase subunit alpha [Bryobacteraceae bacterium]|nr:quinohemoprotein amine dehydrogenase subunit alpha [Bryobacteraceae bacterium]
MKILLASILVFPLLAQAQKPQAATSAEPAKSAPEEGIPVTNQLVITKCGGCHTKDEKGNMLRISWERATPEGWEEAIKRMVRLRGVSLAPDEARSILKYLATYHGLAPDEAKPIMYYAEHRIQDETNIPNDSVKGACANCHPMARPLSWRRSADDWKYLANLHIALYPQADEAFRLGINAGGFDEGQHHLEPGAPLPVDDALAYLSKTAALKTPEWAAWRARMRAPKLTGRWVVSAYIPGRGKFYGDMQVEAASGTDDEFTTKVKLTSVKDGSVISRTGHSVVYAGYSWRGRSKGTPAAKATPDDLGSEMREVMWVSPDQSTAVGRWFWGEYQEFGFDITMQRASADPTLIGVDRSLLKAGSTGTRVRLIAESLPAQIDATDLDFGTGVTVKRVVSHTPTEIVAEVDVAADAVPGKRDIAFKRSVLQSSIAVYDRIDYVKVTPDSALAHLGSEKHPKGFQQFEAVAYQRGADGKLHTADDVELGPIDANWTVEEFYSSYGDDDKEFVGSLSNTGLFSPASDGPNPQRKFSRNNYGDVWVVATAKNEKDKDGKPLVGKSYLVVTVPTYIKWDQPEVGQ